MVYDDKPAAAVQENELPETVLLRASWIDSPVLASGKGAAGSTVLVIDCGKSGLDISGEMNAVFVHAGSAFARISEAEYEVGEDKQSFAELFSVLEQDGRLPETILLLTEDRHGGGREAENTLRLLLRLSSALLKARIPASLLHVCVSENSTSPCYDGAGGFLKTLRLENPKIKVKNVLLSGSHPAAEALLNAVKTEMTDFSDFEVMYQASSRFVKEYEEVTTRGGDGSLDPDGACIITGGAGNLGFRAATTLAEKYRCPIVLTGRSGYNGAIAGQIEELKALGSEAIYIRCDLKSREDTQKLVETAKERFGRIGGVIHCAGVNKDVFIIKKDEKDIEEVLSPKVYGTINLDEATKDEPLRFFILYSSAVSVTGNVGQCDYAFANGCMNGLAVRRSALSTSGARNGRTAAIGWPYFENGGMQISGGQLKAMRAQSGLEPFEASEAVPVAASVIAAGLPLAIVGYGDRQKLLSFFKGLSHAGSPVHSRKEGKADRKLLYKETEKMLKGILGTLLTMSPENIDTETGFDEYGIDSVAVTQFNLMAEAKLGALPKTLLFENHNLGELTKYLVSGYTAELAGLFSPVKNAPELPALPVKGGIVWRTLEPIRRQPPQLQSGTKRAGDIAIIGLSGHYPGGGLNELWGHLSAGRDCISEIPSERWDYRKYFEPCYNDVKPGRMYSKWGGFIKNVYGFDPVFFGISPVEAEIMDPQERVFLQCAWETLEDSGYTREKLRKAENAEMTSGVGVFAGVTTNTYQLLAPEEFLKGNPVNPNSSVWSVANRVSYLFNLHGPSMTVDTACSSSLTAVKLACDSIRKRECTAAIAGGVNLYLHPYKYITLSQMKMLSPTGKCRPFGDDADGIVPGDGVGAVLLKPLESAVADGDHIYGVIKAVTANHGGRTNGYTVPNPNAQANLIGAALQESGINPRTVSYIEAHGTGTKLGDPIEIAGLTRAFKNYTQDNGYCSIGSLKANIGHTESAAGIASLTKVLLMIRNKQHVPSIYSDKLNTNIDFAKTPFYVQQNTSAWERPVIGGKEYPLTAGISSFGAGGSNVHMIVQEYQENSAVSGDDGPFVAVLSARNKERLARYAGLLADSLESETGLSAASIAYTLQTGREAFAERFAAVYHTTDELAAYLRRFINGDTGDAPVYTGTSSGRPAETAETVSPVEAARLWVSGATVDWDRLYSVRPRKISLPTYPFSTKPYCVKRTGESCESTEPNVLPQTEIPEITDVSNLLYMPEWIEEPLPGRDLSQGSILIIYPLWATETADEIERIHGGHAVRILLSESSGAADGGAVYANLFDPLSIEKCLLTAGNVDIVYFLGGIQREPYELTDTQTLENIQLYSIRSFFRFVKAMLGKTVKALKCKVVTCDAMQVLPYETALPFAGGLNGFVRNFVKEKEYENMTACYVDISLHGSAEERRAAVQAAVSEPYGRDVPDIAIRHGRRYVKRLIPAEVPYRPGKPFVTDGVYLIVGGMGSIGFETAKYLSEFYRAKIAIIGRGAMDTGKQQLLDQIKSYGGDAIYESADIADVNALSVAFERVTSKFGRIDAVIHSAMAFTPGPLVETDEQELMKTLRPKVLGMVTLAGVMKGKNVKTLLVFSSGQSFTGNANRTHYAAACNFEDNYAAALRSREGFHVGVVNWGFWGTVKGKPLIPEYLEKLKSQGISPVSPQEGMEIVRTLALYGLSQLAVYHVSDYVKKLMKIDSDSRKIVFSRGERQCFRRIRGITPKSFKGAGDRTFEQFRRYIRKSLLSVFQDMGVFLSPREAHTTDGLFVGLGVIKKYGRLFEALLDILVKAGFVEIADGTVRSTDNVTRMNRTETERLGKELIKSYAEIKPYMKLAGVCLGSLGQILRGEVPATGVMFPDSSMELVEGIYKNNSDADYYNELAAECAGGYAAARAGELQPGRKIRVLEIGAGTGGTTVSVLKALKPYADQIDYYYTDISAAFLQYGREHYFAECPFLKFEKFNIEAPDFSVIGRGSIDIVIAANVLHATRNIRETLKNVKLLLKDGGMLLINEVTSDEDFETITFGLTDGWWMFEDAQNRMKGSPLLSSELWKQLLLEEGYPEIRIFGNGSLQNIIAAESNGIALARPVGQNRQSIGNNTVGVARKAAAEHKTDGERTADSENLSAFASARIVKAVAGVLKMDEQDVGMQTPFMDLGIDSILGEKIVSEIRNSLNVELQTAELFDYATIEKLSAFLSDSFGDRLSGKMRTARGTVQVHEAQEKPELVKTEPISSGDAMMLMFEKLAEKEVSVDDIESLLGRA